MSETHDRADGREGDGAQQTPPPPLVDSNRYEILGFIGEGAMGRVWEARDRVLGRVVALKFLRSDDPDQIARFQREARAQARIDHEHVCPVYEVGEAAGRPYIAMRRIGGRSLREVGDSLTLEQKVRVILQVAEAVHAAHRMGIIHRDIKPANIMVEDDAEAGLRPYILDFGIARDAGSDSHTATDSVVGTPAFMAPEQIQGGATVDRRVDVYGLGATLYALLAGRAPFGGTTRVQTLIRVLEEQPEPLRRIDRKLPRDLETIALTCLEKEPQRRYETARSVADDLRRWLDGESIRARPVGPIARIGRWTRRNRALSIVASVGLISVVFLGGTLAIERHRASTRERLAQQLGQEIEGTESLLRIARMMPLHDTSRARQRVRERMDRIRATAQELGPSGEGPGELALGLGWLALGNLERARDHLEAARRAGIRSQVLDGALGETFGRLYLERREQSERISSSELRAARIDELEARMRQPALTLLSTQTAEDDDVGLLRAALLALLEDRPADALELCRQSRERFPWRYEAGLLDAQVHEREGTAADAVGNREAAVADYRKADTALQTALEIGRSDARLLEFEARLVFRMLKLEADAGRVPDDLFDRGVAAAESAFAANPDSAGGPNAASRLFWLRADSRLDAGEEPEDDLARASEWARRAAEVDDSSPETPLNLAMIARLRATLAGRVGKDPRQALDESVGACRRALELEPDSVIAWANLGTAYYLRAVYEIGIGNDPRGSLQRAADAYRGSLERRATFAAWNNSGLVQWRRAQFEVQRGADPVPALNEAVDCYERALEINPTHGHGWSNLGLILLDQDEALQEKGQDSAAVVQRAIEVLSRAVELQPSLAAAHNNLANAYKARAETSLGQGGDPTQDLDRAVAAYRQAISLNPALAFVYSNLGYVQVVRGRWLRLTGGDPQAVLRDAREVIGDGIARDPGLDVGFFNLAESWLEEARWLRHVGRDPTADLDRARNAADRAVALNPNLYYHRLLRAEIELDRARWLVSLGEAPRGPLGLARADLRNASELSSASRLLRWLEADLAATEASWAVVRGGSGADDVARGLEALGHVAGSDDPDPRTLLSRARLLRLAMVVGGAKEVAEPGAAAEQACADAVAKNRLLAEDCREALAVELPTDRR